MVRVDGDAEPRAQLVAQIVGVLHRVHARAVGGVHRVQRLDRERHARRARVAEELADAVAHHFARAGEILRFDGAGAILRQPAHDEYQAARAQGERLVDRAPVVVLRRAPAFAVRGREHSAAAIAGDRESGVAYAPRRVLQPGGRHLVAPRRDAANAVAGASGDDLAAASTAAAPSRC